MEPNERVIVALDFENATDAMALVESLGASIHSYKVGLQLLTAEGPQPVKDLVAAGKQVFLDLKLHEIPNSVAGAVEAAGRLGASMVTVHASGGSAVLQAAVKAAGPFADLKVLAVTVITSMSDDDLNSIGIDATAEEQVLRLARLAADAGCDGVVASPREASLLRSTIPSDMLIVTPGTQLPSDRKNDQLRTSTPGAAVRAGSTHLVIGRGISRAADPKRALSRILSDISDSEES